MQLLANIRIVLVETSHPGNIGAAARAMKTMGLARLALVAPGRYPSAEATARASGAHDVLHGASEHRTLAEALAGCTYAFATTARRRQLSHVEREPRAAAGDALVLARTGEVAFVFGRERYGLDNAEVDACQGLVRIPAAPDYSSLNLAAAVQIVAYELHLAARSLAGAPAIAPRQLVGPDELEGLHAHFERALQTIGYYDPANPGKLLRRLRRLVARAELDAAELRILRGILTAAERAAGDAPRGRGQRDG